MLSHSYAIKKAKQTSMLVHIAYAIAVAVTSCSNQRRSHDFCLGGATRYIFRHLSGEPTAFSGRGGGGGGVVA